MLEVGVARLLDPAGALELGELAGHRLEVRGARPDRRAEVRRGHERRVEVRLLGEQPDRQPALPRDRPAVRLVRPGSDPQQRRLAGAVRADEPDPVADRDRRRDRVEDDERADLAGHARQPKDRHQPAPDRGAGRRPPGRRGPRVRSVRAGRRASRPQRAARRSPPRPAARSSAGPAASAPPEIVRRIAPRALPVGGRQALAPRAEVRRPAADDDPPDRPAAAPTRLPRPLVDVEVLLHLAVAVGRRVVVDRRAAPLDGLGEDVADGAVQTPLVGAAAACRPSQRVEPRRHSASSA